MPEEHQPYICLEQGQETWRIHREGWEACTEALAPPSAWFTDS